MLIISGGHIWNHQFSHMHGAACKQCNIKENQNLKMKLHKCSLDIFYELRGAFQKGL